MTIFVKRQWATLCSCGWCANEFNFAIMDGMKSVQAIGILVMIFGILQIWAGGMAYSVSSSQEIASGAWWSGLVVYLAGMLGLIRTFQCFPWLKKASIYMR